VNKVELFEFTEAYFLCTCCYFWW